MLHWQQRLNGLLETRFNELALIAIGSNIFGSGSNCRFRSMFYELNIDIQQLIETDKRIFSQEKKFS